MFLFGQFGVSINIGLKLVMADRPSLKSVGHCPLSFCCPRTATRAGDRRHSDVHSNGASPDVVERSWS